jgi:hypothetical protein
MRFPRAAIALLAAAPCILVLLAPSADADPLSGHVQLSGHISCGPGDAPPLPGPGYLAERARFQAANGEAQDASISLLVNYTVDFNNVPAEGETVNVYVTCGGMGREWGTSFQLNRQSDEQQHLDLSG